MGEDDPAAEPRPAADSRQYAGWLLLAAAALLAACVVGSVIVAHGRSEVLTAITVKAVDPAQEPRDAAVPFAQDQDELPDYYLRLTGAERVELPTKPNRSAAGGLRWELTDPPEWRSVTGVTLLDEDQFADDLIASVRLTREGGTDGNVRFAFEAARSWEAGFDAFFDTPVGKVLLGCIGIAALAVLAAAVGPLLGAPW